jgi:hypothetical protein
MDVAESAPPDTTPPDSAQPTALDVACAYGGHGVLPTGADPASFYRVIATLDLWLPGVAPCSCELRDIALANDAGRVLVRVRRVGTIERIAPSARVHRVHRGCAESGADDSTALPWCYRDKTHGSNRH